MLQPGTVFASDYQIVAPLAEGGMGAIYTALQRSTGKTRALKVMLPAIVADPDHRRRFEQEARIGSRIASEHVVEVIEAGIDGATPFLVMELLRGVDLAKHLERKGALSKAEVRAIFAQLCHAVAAAHLVGIVHRDLKPENVFLAESQRADVTFSPLAPSGRSVDRSAGLRPPSGVEVKVLDFGIAKMAAEAGQQQNTRAVGSPLWMSPEQTERGPVSPAADVWALGLIAFQLLTGVHFWTCTDDPSPAITSLLQEILVSPIPSASARATARGVADRLPAGFDAFFSRCVVRDKAQRFSDAGVFWAALEPLLRERPQTVTAVPVAPNRSSSLLPILAVAFVVPIAAAAVFAWFVMRSPPTAAVVPAPTTPTPVDSSTPRGAEHGKATIRGLKGVGTHVHPADLVHVFDQNMWRYELCYDAALARHPGIRGGVTLELVISGNGQASSAKKSSPGPDVTEDVPPMDDLADDAAVRCMIEQTMMITFPPADNGAAMQWLFLELVPQ